MILVSQKEIKRDKIPPSLTRDKDLEGWGVKMVHMKLIVTPYIKYGIIHMLIIITQSLREEESLQNGPI